MLVALIWPEIAEFSVLGVSLKRRVVLAERTAETAVVQAENAARDTANLQAQLNQIAVTFATSSSTSTAHANFFFGSEEWTPERAKQLNVAYNDVRDQVPSLPDADKNGSEAELSMRLIAEYQDLSKRLGLARIRPVGRPSVAVRELYEARREFVADFQAQVDSVRDARNTIAHGEKIPTTELVEAIQIVRYLDLALTLAFRENGVDEGAERNID